MVLVPSASLAVICMASASCFSFFLFGAGPSAIQDIAPAPMRGQFAALYTGVLNLLGAGCGPVAAGALVAVVSLSWMTVVSLTPARDRPWVDGSHHNSVFDQVFVYNGFGRLDQSPLALLNNASLGIELPSSPPAAWNRLLKGVDGRDAGWLLPAGLIAIGGGLIARRRQPREDPVRACVLLWGTWLVVLFAAFTLASSVNPYYTTVFSPASNCTPFSSVNPSP